jgi:hypothetical protein
MSAAFAATLAAALGCAIAGYPGHAQSLSRVNSSSDMRCFVCSAVSMGGGWAYEY